MDHPRSIELLEMVRGEYRRMINDSRCAEFLSRFPLNRFWGNENLAAMSAIINGAQTAEDVIHGAQRTFMFSVNSALPEKEDAVAWLLDEQARREIDLFRLPDDIQESCWSWPENNVGRKGRRLTPDFLRTVNIAFRIRDRISPYVHGPLRVIELGAGLGHLARTLQIGRTSCRERV
jgi:hypothetical protein